MKSTYCVRSHKSEPADEIPSEVIPPIVHVPSSSKTNPLPLSPRQTLVAVIIQKLFKSKFEFIFFFSFQINTHNFDFPHKNLSPSNIDRNDYDYYEDMLYDR